MQRKKHKLRTKQYSRTGKGQKQCGRLFYTERYANGRYKKWYSYKTSSGRDQKRSSKSERSRRSR